MPKPDTDCSLEGLKDWLERECRLSVRLTLGYHIEDLIADLDRILDDQWSNSIDARGEDA